MIEPMVLYDSVSITNGQSALLNAGRMTPPGNRPMMVQDVLFTLRVPVANVRELILGGVVRARLRAGRFDLSNAHVPVWLYGSTPNLFVDRIQQEVGDIADATGQKYGISRFRWILPKPMYLPPGAVFQASISRDDTSIGVVADVTGAAITVQMSVRGMLVHGRAATTHVPFVGSFVPGTGQLQSLEDDLRNTLDKPVDVHRLNGRMSKVFGTVVEDVLGGSQLTTGVGAGTAFRNEIRIRDNNQLEITNGFVPMCSVIPAQGRTWTFKRRMNVGDQLVVQLDRVPTVVAWPMMSFVGSREERA